MNARGIALASAVVLGMGAVAVAQEVARRPVLHEDLPPPGTGAGNDGAMVGDAPRAGQNPTAIASGSKLLPEPVKNAGAADREPVLGQGGFAADRDTETRPDRETSADGVLKYVSVFNPDVLPFKRMSALDTVAVDYTLGVASGSLTDLPVGGVTDATRDRFWGSVLVELRPGVDVPLPSVAPDMRILSYEAEPPITLTFSKDGADNFYVRSDESNARGTYRVVFLSDADAGYFAPGLPTANLTPKRVRELAPAGTLAPLPPTVARQAERILRETLKVKDSQPLGTAVNALVGYFRAFEAKEPPPPTVDVYRDLTIHQAGVCRHRAFAFMITANALGLPTRYVTNEAHAFVEMWLPQRGWQRIDLGGAALRMEVSGASDKTLHRPRGEDPFARPPAYDGSYTQLDGDIQGLRGDQISDRQRPLGDDPSGAFKPMVAGDPDDPGSNDDSGKPADPAPGKPGDVASTDGAAVTPGADQAATSTDPARLTPTLTITLAASSAYRGEDLHVEGRVDEARAPVPNLRVDVFLAPAGRDGTDAVLVGHGTSGPDGRFALDVSVPGSLDIAKYDLFVSTPGDARYNAAVSD